jgi:hypothetical protein
MRKCVCVSLCIKDDFCADILREYMLFWRDYGESACVSVSASESVSIYVSKMTFVQIFGASMCSFGAIASSFGTIISSQIQ